MEFEEGEKMVLWGIKIVWGYILSIARICAVLIIALFLPKIFLVRLHSAPGAFVAQNPSSFRLGIESLSDQFLKGLTSKGDLSYKVGLVTNQSGKDQCGKRTLDILFQHGLNVVSLFAPEHGMDGDIAMMRDVQDSKDKKSNLKIISMYGNGSPKRFDQKFLTNIDVLFFDMQDSGMRHYTFITTMFEVLEAASKYNKVAVVLDRPNLLGPYMEGPIVDDGLKSAISYASIPVRYGMTVGELAFYFNKKILKKPAKLHVVPMQQYDRLSYGARGLITRLSPNITNINSCYGYSFLGLLGEVRPFDVGVGTNKAFQCILLPEYLKFTKKKWHELYVLFQKQGVESSFYRYYSVRKKYYCSGLRLHIPDINSFSSFSTFLMVLQFFRKEGVALTFSPAFDKAIGSKRVRLFLQGELSKDLLVSYVNENLKLFFRRASEADCFLYRPFPKVVNLS